MIRGGKKAESVERNPASFQGCVNFVQNYSLSSPPLVAHSRRRGRGGPPTRTFRIEFCGGAAALSRRSRGWARRRGSRLTFRSAKITRRAGGRRGRGIDIPRASHFDQFHGCSAGRTFHTPTARPKGTRRRVALHKGHFQRARPSLSESKRIERRRGGVMLSSFPVGLAYFLCVNRSPRSVGFAHTVGRTAQNERKRERENLSLSLSPVPPRGALTSFVLFPPASRAPHRPPVRRTHRRLRT